MTGEAAGRVVVYTMMNLLNTRRGFGRIRRGFGDLEVAREGGTMRKKRVQIFSSKHLFMDDVSELGFYLYTGNARPHAHIQATWAG